MKHTHWRNTGLEGVKKKFQIDKITTTNRYISSQEAKKISKIHTTANHGDIIPYSRYFSRGNIFVKVVILAISWKNFRCRAVCVKTTLIDPRFFVGKYFVVHLSTTKTTKILPPEKYPLYGIHRV